MTSEKNEPVEPRILAAWREWLSALAVDAEAAIAAAHVYAELPPEGRNAWLDALSEDSPKLPVPIVAVYAPLLSVESDPERRARIERAIGQECIPASTRSARALRGIAADRSRVALLVAPLYLDFVQILSCRYNPHEGFRWVRHDPIRSAADAPRDGDQLDGVVLEETPMKLVVEDLAHAILAQRRRGDAIPTSLNGFARLFDVQADGDSEAPS